MIYKKLQVFIIFCLLSFQLLAENFFDVQQIEQQFQTSFNLFDNMRAQKQDVQFSLAPQFFLQFNLPYQKIIKNLHKSIKVVKQEIKILKRTKQSFKAFDALKNNLSQMYNFIKKHRLECDVVVFHQFIKDSYSLLFQAILQGQDIASFMHVIDIEQTGIEGLRLLLKKVEKDLQKIETFEYRLHTDWIDTKLANYVLKIELTRLRNAILFHPLYKRTKLKLSSNYPR